MKGWSLLRTALAAGASTFVVALAALAVLAPGAGAVLVRIAPHQIAGITLRRGVSPLSVSGSLARPAPSASGLASAGQLDYNGGAVLHAAAPYLIFWDPSSEISAGDRALYARYFADSAADSGSGANVYSVDRQFSDATGFADYRQSFSPSQEIVDANPFPTTGNCPQTGSGYPRCLTDTQLQAEISRVVDARGLPSGIGGNAPIYFIVTPQDTNVCADASSCASNVYCAYHSGYAHNGDAVLYAAIPLLPLRSAATAKSCQSDGNSTVQEPNGSYADVAIKYISHELSETITDPLGNGWYNRVSGNEDGDNCAFTGSFDPAAGSNPDAFLPVLGGSASAGTLYDQLVAGDRYYIQSEWSNGNGNCRMAPTSAALSPAFTAPATSFVNASAALDPSASTSPGGFSSVSWDFGDGTQSFAPGGPSPISHAYTTPGQYTVTLTLVDTYGNLASTSHTVVVPSPPAATFAVAPVVPVAGRAASLDASGSSDLAAPITSYAWSLGDGTTGSGRTLGHTFAAEGVYTVTLTVTDSLGQTATRLELLSVDEPPVASFKVRSSRPASREAIRFSAAASSDPDGSIVSYSWSFGDGSRSASGRKPKHAYRAKGRYPVVLTVTDSAGVSSTTEITVHVVKAARIRKVSVSGAAGALVLRVKVSGPGRVQAGHQIARLHNAGTATFRLGGAAPSRRLTVTFSPIAGPVQRKRVRL